MDTTTVRFGDLKLKLCCILRRMCSIFNLNQDTIRLQIGATTKSLTELETMFGEIPWNDVRISAKKTQHLERVSRAIVRGSDDDKQICRAVAVPGFHDHSTSTSNNKRPSEVENMLGSLLGMIDPNRYAEGRELVQSLKDCLRSTCGRVPRRKGGWQYADSFMLDSVLFADNLRPLHDGDLMQETVKQFLGIM